MLVEAFVADKVSASGDYLGMVTNILQALPDNLQLTDPDSTAELDELSRFLLAALKWAHKQGAPDSSALAMRKYSLVALLQSRYQPSLAVDPSFEAYLSTVEQLYFPDIARPAGGGGGLLAGLLRGLLADGDESEDDA
eukprot:gene13104-13232_t